LLTAVVYIVLIFTLHVMQSYHNIDVDAPFSVAFSIVGMDWNESIVTFGVLKWMTTVLVVNAIEISRWHHRGMGVMDEV
jgi:APA family basic amino acid/polyamine antiporter